MSAKGYVEIPLSEWAEMRERLAKLEADMRQLMDNHLKHCMDEIHYIKRKISTNRPTWAVTIILTFLTSLCVGLIVHHF